MKLIPALGTAVGLALVVAAPAARAADWSIGIGIGLPGVVVAPSPVYVAPPPRYYQPHLPPVYVLPPGYYGSVPVYVRPPGCDHGCHEGHDRHRGWHGSHHEDDDDDDD